MNYDYKPRFYNIGSVEDIRTYLNNDLRTGKLSLPALKKEIAAEQGHGRKRKTVITCFNAFYKRLEKQVLQAYPRTIAGKPRYVRYPTIINGKFVAVDVQLPTGYNELVSATEFESEEACETACDASNRLFFSDAEAINVVYISFKNAEV